MRAILKEGSRQYAVSKKVGREFTAVLFLFVFSAYYLLPSAYSDTNELKDVKPPVDLPEPPLLLIAAIILAASLFIFGIWYWFRHKKRTEAKVEIKTPWDLAYEQLQDLKRRDLVGQGKPKEHFIELSAIARGYIEGRFHIHAPEMTTEEFLDHVKDSASVEPRYQGILKDFLQLCDMVKFAKYPPTAQEAAQSFELVRRFVDETKETSPAPVVAEVSRL